MNPIAHDAAHLALGASFLEEARGQLAASHTLIAHCVSQLEEAQVWGREHEALNSIGNLLLHLSGNLTQRFASNVCGEPDHRDRPREFAERSEIPRTELMAQFDGAVALADAVLSRFDPAGLDAKRPYTASVGTDEISVMAVILRTLIHLNGHAQEIVYMTRRMLGDGYRFRQAQGVPKLSSTTSA